MISISSSFTPARAPPAGCPRPFRERASGAMKMRMKTKIKFKIGGNKIMTYIQPSQWTLPKPGPAVLCLIDEIDLGLEPAFKPGEEPKPKVRLVFAVDQTDANGKPIIIFQKVTQTRHKQGTLLKYVSTFCHPNQITPADWQLSSHIGKCIGAVLQDNENHTYSNAVSLYPLPPTAVRIGIPVGYIRKGGTAPAGSYNVSSSTTPSSTINVNQSKPVQSVPQVENVRTEDRSFQTGGQQVMTEEEMETEFGPF